MLINYNIKTEIWGCQKGKNNILIADYYSNPMYTMLPNIEFCVYFDFDSILVKVYNINEKTIIDEMEYEIDKNARYLRFKEKR